MMQQLSPEALAEIQSGKGTKDDRGKVRLSLLPFLAIIKIAEVFTYGAKKYSDNNWRNGMSWNRMYDALLRHLFAWHRGDELDPESGLPHLAHAGCCLLMLFSYTLLLKRYASFDDRWKNDAY